MPEAKQNASKTSGNPQIDNFNAEELGEQSIYEGETEIAQRMRRGSASQEEGDKRDVVGAPDFEDTNVGREHQNPRSDE